MGRTIIEMEEAYYTLDKPDSLGGLIRLRRQMKLSDEKIRDYLSKQDAYALHKRIVRKFQRRRTYTKGINDLFQIDLIDVSSLAHYNEQERKHR